MVQQTKLSTGEVRDFGYDALNRLVSVRQDGVLMARYGYDVLGRRIAKRVYSSASDGVPGYTRFIYHGENVAFQADSAGAMGLRFTWGLGTDDLRAVQDAAGQNYYVVQDKLGSVRGLFERNGTWRASVRFNPYGDLVAIDSAGSKPPIWYAWTGREFDEETGWYYHRARYYSPLIRRFVQEDPIGYSGGANLYAYVEGMALEATDPTGTRMREVDAGGAGVRNAFAAASGGMMGSSFGASDMQAVFGSGAGYIATAQAQGRLAQNRKANQAVVDAQAARPAQSLSQTTARHASTSSRSSASQEPQALVLFVSDPTFKESPNYYGYKHGPSPGGYVYMFDVVRYTGPASLGSLLTGLDFYVGTITVQRIKEDRWIRDVPVLGVVDRFSGLGGFAGKFPPAPFPIKPRHKP